VKMATGEVIDEESLGGADLHATRSGLADFLAENELEAIRRARQILGRLPRPSGAFRPASARPPRYPPEEILQIVPADPCQPFDIRELIARVVDDSRFLEFKPLWGSTLVAG
jgi:acetyl-CoA carboxylase carboxyltransferase component